MGIFKNKWIVEFEFSKGLFSSTKKASIVVEAGNEYSAKDIAKSILKPQYFYVKVLSATRDDGNTDKKESIFNTPISTEYNSHIKHDDVGQTNPNTRTPEEIKRDQAEVERIYKRESINSKINELKTKEEKIKKSPKTIGFSSAILSLLAFILGWIPYWYWDYRRASFKKIVEDLYAEGRTINDPFTYEMYLEGLHAKEMRNSLIWIPLVILAIGIVVTIILVVHANKAKDFKLKVIKSKTDKLKNELDDVAKISND